MTSLSPADIATGTAAAHAQALKSLSEGGVPVGACLMLDGQVVAVGHNQRVQKGSNVLHGETDCLEAAGHTHDLTRAAMFTTLAPCLMCTGAIELFKIPTLVVLDQENIADFTHGLPRLRESGVEVIDAPHAPTIELMRKFQTDPTTRRIWMGDVGL
ncbi:MAG: nucleoside deaminase [Pseudomonadota bacterium]